MGPRSPIIWVGWSVFTIIGNLLMSLLNGQQVRQLQTKFLKLSDNVSNGMSCVAQMGCTVEALSHAVDTFHKVFFRQNKRWDFTLLWDETFADIDNAVSNTMEMVASAAAQTLHPILLMPVDAEKLALQIAGLRHERSLVPIIEDRSASRLQGHDSDICTYALYAGLTSLALSTCARAKVTEDTVVRKVGPIVYVV